jgi:hypothetical protein
MEIARTTSWVMKIHISHTSNFFINLSEKYNMKKYILILFFISLFNNNNIFGSEKDFVSLINGFFDESQNVVVLNWETLDNPKAVYRIYRTTSPVKGKRYIPIEAELIKVVSYNVDNIIDIPSVTGKYYYVITVYVDGMENNLIQIDQNYTYSAIDFYRPAGIVRNIKVKYIPQNQQVLVQWEPPVEGEKVKYYTLYRSLQFIDKTNLELAKKLSVVGEESKIYFDKIDNPGKYFYALTATSVHNFENMVLVKDDNTMSKPIVVSGTDTNKLPEFYIQFPAELTFDYKPRIEWFKIPAQLKQVSIDIISIYGEEKKPNLLEEEKKKLIAVEKKDDKKGEEKKEDPKADNPELKKDIKKEVKEVQDLFNLYYKFRSWQDFIKEAELKNKDLKSEYARKKLLLLKAFSYFQLKNYIDSILIIRDLKSDIKFLKYNRLKIEELERKLKKVLP